jgi:hypothetical protein
MTKEKTIKVFKLAAKACSEKLYSLITEPLENETLARAVGDNVLDLMLKVHAVQTEKAEELKEILQTIRKLEDDHLVPARERE